MKTSYVKPEIETIEVRAEQSILAASMSVSEKTTDTYDSKQHDFSMSDFDLWSGDGDVE